MPAPRVMDLSESPLLGRFHPADARALNRLHACAVQALPLLVRGQPFALRLRAAPTAAACAPYRFTLGAHAGTLALDPLAEVLLFDDRRAPMLPFELRCVLLAEATQAFVEDLERRTRLRFDWQPAAAAAPAAGAGLAFTLSPAAGGLVGGGVLRLDQAGALDALVPAAAPDSGALPPWLDGLPVRLVFTLGSTPLRLHEMRAIRAGDIVAVENWTSEGPALRLHAQLGGRAGTRVLARAEDRRITVTRIEDTTMNRELPEGIEAVEDAEASSPRLDRLDAMEVTLRFDVGEQTLTLGTLKNLRPGHVFELPHTLDRCPVDIVAHGNRLGRGILVAVGDRLGVRISEFAPGEA